MQTRVAKLEAKEVLNEKEAKRLATYRNRLAAHITEFNEAKAAHDVKALKAKQKEAALEVKEHVLNTAEDQLDKRETTMDRRDDELQLREADVTRREGVLDRLTDDIGRMISDIAERLGVGDSLRPIRCGKPFRTAAVQYCVTHHSGAPFSVGPCVRPLLAGPAHCL